MRTHEPVHRQEPPATAGSAGPAIARLHALAGNAAVARALAPLVTVQRLKLGANGELETTNAAHREAVLAELGSMDERSLRVVRELLVTSAHPLDRSYVEWIDVDLARAEGLANVNTGEQGIWTQAILFVDGIRLFTTPAAKSGERKHRYFSHAHVDLSDWARNEKEVSVRDSEVATLGDAYDHLTRNVRGANRVRLLLLGNFGPCDGCKARVLRWAQWVRDFFRNRASVEVETSYTSPVQDRVRGRTRIPTRYGYPDATRRTDARGHRYWTRTNRPYWR